MKGRSEVFGTVLLVVTLIMPMSILAVTEQEGKTQQGSIQTPAGSTSAPALSGRQKEDGGKLDSMPVYKPPLRGAPGGRLAGGARGSAEEMPRLYLLAPDHVGLTVKEQPVLYWFVSERSKYPLELSIIQVSIHEPIIETQIRPPKRPGVHSVRLADLGVRLKIGVLYRWFVKIVTDSGQRSKDIVAIGEIERIELSEGLRTKLKRVGKKYYASIFAQEGLWYDALAAVSGLVDASPKQRIFRQQRAFLLQQGGLNDVAEYERETFCQISPR